MPLSASGATNACDSYGVKISSIACFVGSIIEGVVVPSVGSTPATMAGSTEAARLQSAAPISSYRCGHILLSGHGNVRIALPSLF